MIVELLDPEVAFTDGVIPIVVNGMLRVTLAIGVCLAGEVVAVTLTAGTGLMFAVDELIIEGRVALLADPVGGSVVHFVTLEVGLRVTLVIGTSGGRAVGRVAGK